jgi:hypothetical protein
MISNASRQIRDSESNTRPHTPITKGAVPLNWLRRRLEATWIPPARIVNTFCTMGALLGFICLGDLPFWLLLFPPAMAMLIKLISRWGWLPSALNEERPRRGLRFLYAAPLSLVLFIPPLCYIWIMPFAVLLAPLVMAYSRLYGVEFHLPTSKSSVWRRPLWPLSVCVPCFTAAFRL